MKKIFIKIIGLCVLFVSCNTNKSFLRLEKQVDVYNASKSNKKIFLGKKFNPIKEIFQKLKIQDTTNIVLIFTWNNHLPISNTKDYNALVFNESSKKILFIKNTIEQPKKILISTTNLEGFKEGKFILENFLNNKIDYIKSFENQIISAESGQNYCVFKINNQNVNVENFEQIVFFKDSIPFKIKK